MKHQINIINGINKILIVMSKGDVADLDITNKTDKYKNLLKEMDEVYRCVRTSTINKVLIGKTRNHITNTMILWRELKNTSYSISSFIGRSYFETNDYYKRWYS